jgi:hypothetical protein
MDYYYQMHLPKWEEKEQMAKKEGPHAMVYMTNGDTFQGEWKNDLKDGKIFLTYYANYFFNILL